jgi:hypothetical protein
MSMAIWQIPDCIICPCGPFRLVKSKNGARPQLLVIDPEGVVLPAQGEALGFLYAEKETIYDPVAMSFPKTCSMNF